MDSKIIKIVIVGLTTVLALCTISKNDFLKVIAQNQCIIYKT
ncbi:hypothetical protein HNP37_004113 [Flavobacterium nitrogenifigens]|uniref:Uncharacterized protein n=2 Tax=Flavobacterium TaxID=237 RepID=A0A7W7N8N9_9FLAO|nr:hypothetical protein [Flavobacterium nitrogenifigens]MBB6388815.1 hypothetical protein [Flavobacterium notoginsengisoli]